MKILKSYLDNRFSNQLSFGYMLNLKVKWKNNVYTRGIYFQVVFIMALSLGHWIVYGTELFREIVLLLLILWIVYIPSWRFMFVF